MSTLKKIEDIKKMSPDTLSLSKKKRKATSDAADAAVAAAAAKEQEELLLCSSLNQFAVSDPSSCSKNMPWLFPIPDHSMSFRPLNKRSKEFKAVVSACKDNNEKFVVAHVTKVINEELKEYHQLFEKKATKLGYYFHGTPGSSNIVHISRQGLDERVSKVNGRVFGNGSYLSADFGTAVFYSRNSTLGTIFLFRVLSQNSYLIDVSQKSVESFNRPPVDPDTLAIADAGQPCPSASGDPSDKYIICRRFDQAFPSYLIHFIDKKEAKLKKYKHIGNWFPYSEMQNFPFKEGNCHYTFKKQKV